MAGSTDHYGLTTLGTGDAFSTDGYKYTEADRRKIDGLLWLGAEAHIHDGSTGSIEEPDDPLQLTLNITGGTLPAGTRIFYKWTLVNSRGEESIASTETFIDTPDALAEPSAPGISYASTGGSLQGGNYFYVLSAYVDTNIAESKALNPVYITIPATTITNEITLDLPDPPIGATGFNVYRRLPGQSKYYWLDDVVTDVATPPTTFVDDGSVEEDCDRTIPVANTTNATNSVDIELPVSFPEVPEGYTWKIYRTYIDGDWSNSLLTHVVEYTNEATPIITTMYTDVGISTSDGQPPTASQVTNSPSKILLTGGAEVQGVLSMGMVAAFPYAVTMFFPGTLTAGVGEAEWPCPFENAQVVQAVAALGRGSVPVADDVIVDVVIGKGDPPSFTSVYAAQGDMPTIAVGDNKTATAATATGTLINRSMTAGDVLSADIIQEGGSATPTDEDLTITVLLYVQVTELDSIF